MTLREQIDDFLAQRTLAIIGVSRHEKDFSRVLMREFQERGYAVMPVNLHGGTVGNLSCYASIRDIPTSLDAALVMLPPSAHSQAVKECAEAGVKRLWIYGIGRPGKLDEETRTLCREHGISVVNGFCPLMFLQKAAWPHRLHGWFATKIQHSKFELQTQ